MRLHGLHVPVLANVFALGATARYFHAGKIPGVTVTDELLALAEKQAASPDKGLSFFLELAAKQCAIARGLGYRGAYLGGHLRLEDYDRILRIVDSFAEYDWREFAECELHGGVSWLVSRYWQCMGRSEAGKPQEMGAVC